MKAVLAAIDIVPVEKSVHIDVILPDSCVGCLVLFKVSPIITSLVMIFIPKKNSFAVTRKNHCVVESDSLEIPG